MADVEPSAQAEPSAAELAMLADWRSNLAALASYVASPADEALIVRLGDSLWEKQGQASLSLCPNLDALPPMHHAVFPCFHKGWWRLLTICCMQDKEYDHKESLAAKCKS